MALPTGVALSVGGVAERSMAADCKSADECLRWFESNPLHHFLFARLGGRGIRVVAAGASIDGRA